MSSLQLEQAEQQRRFRSRGLRYVLLSLLLTLVLVAATSCAALLIGDNRDAYDRLERASRYFKYPSSVQIVSGEMANGTLYCCIMAKNGFGNYRYDTYAISSSGYPTESSSSRCYATGLNCDLINSSLADYYGVSYTSSGASFALSLKSILGGINSMWEILFIVLVVYLILNGLLASKASDMAQDKGYEKRTWFHMCFWLGIVSYIIIAGMPDKVMRSKQDKTNELLEKLIDLQGTAPAGKAQEEHRNVEYFLPEL